MSLDNPFVNSTPEKATKKDKEIALLSNSCSKQNGSDPNKTAPSGSVQMRRSVGLLNGVSIIIGVIIGSGIFISPQGVLKNAGSPGAALCVWCACGVLALLGALCFAELGTSVSASGGEYTYIRLAYGELAGFLYLWIVVVVIVPCSNAVSALTFAKYCLGPFYDADCQPPDMAVRFLALFILFTLVYINCVSVRASAIVQNYFSLAKVAALGLIIVIGLYHLGAGEAPPSFQAGHIWDGTETSVFNFARAFYSGFYTYSGWNALNCVTEELKEPTRNMPRAIVISISVCTLIYVLANVAYFAVLPCSVIIKSEAIAVIFGESINPLVTYIIQISVALSTMGGLNAAIFASSRVYFAAARQKQLFESLEMIHVDKLTPITSLLFLALTSILYLFTTKILELIEYMILVESAFALLGVSTLLALRYKLPNLTRPLRVPLVIPIIYLMFTLVLIVMPIYTDWVKALVGLCIVALGLPVYFLTVRWRHKPKSYQNCIDQMNILIQKLTKSVVPTSMDQLASA